MQFLKVSALGVMLGSLIGCAKAPRVTYNPQDFVNPNRVVTHTIPMKTPTPHIAASFQTGDDPAIEKAYRHFLKTGEAKRVVSRGFITYPYDAYSHPLVSCAPLHLCVVQLETDEHINTISLGDAAHWLVSTALVGTADHGSYQIAIKPKAFNLATDMVVTTDKRTYNIGLVSQPGAYTHVVKFYYPEETLQQQLLTQTTQHEQEARVGVLASMPQVAINALNFNYHLQGDDPLWRPWRVFDDGRKTYIQLSPRASQGDLPVLYIKRQTGMALVNYRYHAPYYIVDTLFHTAYLVSGKGRHQVRVEIQQG